MSPYVHLEELQRYFENLSQSAAKKECWFEMNGNAVAWDIPLGVAVSLYSKEEKDQEVPINIILHQRNCPSHILKLENMSQIKSRFLNSLKDVNFQLKIPLVFIRAFQPK